MDHLKHVSAVVFEIQPLLVKDLECYIYVTLGVYDTFLMLHICHIGLLFLSCIFFFFFSFLAK